MNSPTPRQYRSNRVKPCDACRVRKVACVPSGCHGVCSLCRNRNTSCTFNLKPAVRKKRQQQQQQQPVVVSPPNTTISCSSSSSDGRGLRHHERRSNRLDYLKTPSRHIDPVIAAVDVVQEHMDTRPHEILDQFYESTHPSLPILGSRRSFERDLLERQNVPRYLSVVVTLHALHFDQSVMDLNGLSIIIRPWIYSCLMEASQYPSLHAIQCALLFMHLPSSCEDSHSHRYLDENVLGVGATPAIWGLTATVVAMAQNLGLDVEPRSHAPSLPPPPAAPHSLPSSGVEDGDNDDEEEEEENEERTAAEHASLRRVLWWAVYINEKWTSHLSGRPSHIHSDGWDVSPPILSDFGDDAHSHPGMAECFIGMSSLAILLSDVADGFYQVAHRYERMELSAVIDGAKAYVDRLQQWNTRYYDLIPGLDHHHRAHEYTKQLMSHAVCLKIHRAVYGAHILAGTPDDLGRLENNLADSMRRDLFRVLHEIKVASANGCTGLWLSYIRGNLVIFAEACCDVGDTVLLAEYEEHLAALTVGYEIRAGMCNFPHAAIEHLQRFLSGV